MQMNIALVDHADWLLTATESKAKLKVISKSYNIQITGKEVVLISEI